MALKFKGLDNMRARKIFQNVYERYPVLQQAEVVIESKPLKGVTMRALPGAWSFFFHPSRKHYKIQVANYVRDSDEVKVEDLDDDVLEGWMAHEMGHVVDYHQRSFLQMVIYGLRYWLSKSFARHVEHEADRIAVNHGFLDVIIATKRFLFYSPSISIGYRTRLEKLYMSIDEVKLCVPEEQRLL